ncbi:MAG: hypothetical protein IT324_25615 [Anaerolineae bacterium]|nr:hypothetical protein [Anaerolineae bacterium]
MSSDLSAMRSTTNKPASVGYFGFAYYAYYYFTGHSTLERTLTPAT